MKIARLLLFSVLACFTALTSRGQDIHFTMFDMAPLTVNPAYTGAYEGTFRIGGIYRDQWNSISNANGYRTPSVYIDAPLFRAFGEYDWVGGGFSFVNDKRGTVAINTMDFRLSLAYHFPLGKSRKVYLSVGLNGGFVQDKLDLSRAIDGGMVTGGSSTPTISVNSDNISRPDFSAGLLLNSIINPRLNFNVGFAAQHLVEPSNAFLAASNSKDARRYVAHAGVNVDLSSRLVLSPMGFFQLQSNANELNLQTILGIHMNSAKDITLQVGGGYRLSDAAFARIGLLYKGFKFGAAYDITTSSLTKASSPNAFEVAISYIAKIYRNRIKPPVIFCPRF